MMTEMQRSVILSVILTAVHFEYYPVLPVVRADDKVCYGDNLVPRESGKIGSNRGWLRQSESEGRIINGVFAVPGDIPYQIALLHKKVSPGFYCGGILYKEDTVITAAHCLSLNMSGYDVVAGEHHLVTTSGNEQRRTIKAWIIHDKYNNMTFFYDIALITVNVPFEYTKFVQPIGKLDKNYPGKNYHYGEHLRVSGWGSISTGGNPVTVLRVANVPYQKPEYCREKLCEIAVYNTKIMICAGGGSQDACGGDSGGPLVLRPSDEKLLNNPKEHILVGITSFGPASVNCGTEDVPGAYVNVAEFHDWILTNTQQHSVAGINYTTIQRIICALFSLSILVRSYLQNKRL